jgi:radical SAM protein with 4Fe4S-binding SPASM domain
MGMSTVSRLANWLVFKSGVIRKGLKGAVNLPPVKDLYDYIYSRRIQHVVAQREAIGLPNEVIIETTNRCNAKCVMCPRDALTRPLGTMSQELYEKIVGECSQIGIKALTLHNFGEPLLDRRIIPRIQYAKQRGIPIVRMNTNASLLDAATAVAILESGLDEITFSFDGFSSETYETIRRNLKFQVVHDNISRFLKLKREGGYSKPVTCILLTTSQQNAHEVGLFRAAWQGRADRVAVSYASNRSGAVENARAVIINRCAEAKPYPCIALWVNLIVLWNGDVALCCADFDGEVLLGNVQEQTLCQVWNGKEMQRIRSLHLTGQPHQIRICADCRFPRSKSVWWTQDFS